MNYIPDAAVRAAQEVLWLNDLYDSAVRLALAAALPHLVGEMVGTINRMGERNDELDAEVAERDAEILDMVDAEIAKDKYADELEAKLRDKNEEIARLRAVLQRMVGCQDVVVWDGVDGFTADYIARAALEPPGDG